jgi:hypothetical protein
MSKDIKPDGQKLTVRISDTLDQWYTVKKKPNKAPKHDDKGRPIQWVACFGFALKPGVGQGNRKLDSDGFISGELEEAYTISLTKDGDQLVYYDGKKIEALAYSPGNARPGDTVRATLKVGDPPIGWS